MNYDIRPHPYECSGSDLDGDIYFVCWDSDLIPPRQYSPMDYTPAPTTILDHDVTVEVLLIYNDISIDSSHSEFVRQYTAMIYVYSSIIILQGSK